jgi:3',5'-nucleoside bisphosphate phosphatase
LNIKERYADLHVHTHYSDSTFSPEEVVRTAHHEGLSAIAITDHDCVDAIPFCMDIAKDYNLEIIPGIELTVEINDCEVHMLGYYIDWQARWFREKLGIIQNSRIERIHKMIALLKKHGIDVDPAEVFKIAGKGSVGRLHLAFAMLKTQKIRSLQEAFSKYIGFLKSCYVGHTKFSPKEALGIILDAGGVPVVAHPNIMGNDRLFPEFLKYGLRGIEVYHTDHDERAERKYLKIAEENNLLITGGSDCHGMGKGRVLLGSVKVKYSLVEALKKEAEKIQKSNTEKKGKL